ncbi:MAG: hypothetical protein SPJ35_07655, partial [Bacteroidaceae bacterium]|nr:hypothetical protein [Bacteroidaceae bacterium]
QDTIHLIRPIRGRKKNLSCGVLPSRQQYRVEDYPGTPPPSVYQVTHGTAFNFVESRLHSA